MKKKYKLLYTKKAVDDLKKLDILTRKRIGKKLLKYTKDPFLYAIKLTDKRIGEYRFRIGDHRIVFDREWNRIVILRIRHRKDIHK